MTPCNTLAHEGLPLQSVAITDVQTMSAATHHISMNLVRITPKEVTTAQTNQNTDVYQTKCAIMRLKKSCFWSPSNRENQFVSTIAKRQTFRCFCVIFLDLKKNLLPSFSIYTAFGD